MEDAQAHASLDRRRLWPQRQDFVVRLCAGSRYDVRMV
jgi:hypothetical protein